MALQIFLVLFLSVTAFADKADDKKEVATSYSVIYRYDTSETKNDTESTSETAKPIANEKIPPFFERKPIVYEITPTNYENSPIIDANTFTSQNGELKTSTTNAFQKDIEQNSETYTSKEPINQAIPTGYIEFQNVAPSNINTETKTNISPVISLESKSITYPSLISAPIIQEGRLTTPGLSAYASSGERNEKESSKPTSYSEGSTDSYVSFSEREASHSW